MKIRYFRTGFLVLLLITVVIFTFGPPRFPSLSDLQWKVYALRADTLAMTLSEDGNTLWFGTDKGLLEVDVLTGKQKKVAAGLVGSRRIKNLLNDGYGGLWVGTIDCLKHFGGYNEGAGAGNPVYSLAKDGTRGLWVGQHLGLSYLEFNKKWQRIFTPGNSKLPYRHIRCLLSDGSGGVWIGMFRGRKGGSEAHLAHLKANGRWQFFNLESFGAPSSKAVNALLFDGHGGLWVGTDTGLAHLKPDTTWQFYTHNNSGLPDNNITSLADDGYGGLWLGTRDGLAHLTQDNTWEVFNKDNSGIPSKSVTGIVMDNEHNLWVNTGHGYAHFIPLRKNNTAKLMYSFVSFYFQQDNQVRKPADSQALVSHTPNTVQLLSYQNAKRLFANKMMSSLKREPPESAWFRDEKAFSRSFLTKNKYDILVVPFQAQYSAIDHIGRSLMTYRLALEIETGTNLKVAPLFLVYQALGSRTRFFNEEDVYNLANKIGVSQIIWGYSGHKSKRALNLSLAVQTGAPFSAQSELRHKTLDLVPFSSVDLPYQVFSGRLGEIMEFLQLANYRPVPPETCSTFVSPQLPESPLELFDSEPENALSQASRFQLLGMLTPELSEYTRDYFFIRSLVALSQASPDSPGYNLLAARAYFHLHRRPAAVKMIGTPVDPAEKSFLELLNGNLTELEQELTGIKPSLDRLFAKIELADLKYRYRITPKPDYSVFVEQYPEWQYLLSQRFRHADPTALYSNSELKRILERDFPLPGVSSEELVQAAIASGDKDRLSKLAELSFFDHIRNSFEQGRDDLSLPRHSSGPDTFDYLTMLAGIGRANLLKQIEFYVYWRKDPHGALNLIDFSSEIYKEHPSFMLLKAQALYDSPERKEAASQERIAREIYYLALNGLWWSGGQDRISRIFDAYILKFGGGKKIDKRDDFIKGGYIQNGISTDFPSRSEHEPIGTLDEKLAWSHDGFWMLYKRIETLIKEKSFSNAAELLEKYKHRFHGHPDMTGLLANLAKRKGDTEEAKRLYLTAIRQTPLVWANYYLLGKIFIAEGEYDQAREVFFDFPVFSSQEGLTRVALSNTSYFAGEALFSQGAYEQAKPFFEYSADLNTYSSNGLTSHARLAVLDRDFKTAAMYFIRRARRYNSAKAYGEYLSCLHVIGESGSAWAIFNERLDRDKVPHIWTSALIGHRLAGISNEELCSWLRETAAMNKTSKQRGYPARYGFLNLMDREPDMDMVEVINSVDDLANYQITQGGYSIFNALGERLDRGSLLHTDVRLQRVKQSNSVPVSYYATLANAYLLLQQKDYQGAWDAFEKRSTWYGYIGSTYGKSLLSYLAWAGVKSGKEKKVVEFIERVQKEHQRYNLDKSFDLELARAAVAAARSNHGAAVTHLKTAFTVIPQIGKRPQFPWYQLVELCEWLYEDSGYEPYRDLALSWSQKHQVIQPLFAWAYAVEARYTPDPQARIRALAFAQYLDIRSARISHFSKQEKTAAAKWMEENGGFFHSAERGVAL
jgi:tetratricopeptide (TPR) repeat protein